MPTQVPPPIDDIETYWSPAEKAMVERALACSFIGTASTVAQGIAQFLEATQADELMITAHLFDQAARLRSIEIVAGVRDELNAKVGAAHAVG